MSSSLVSVLHHEERSIVAELRASKPFQRLEAIRKLLALYDAQPSVATGLDVPVSAEPDRTTGEVINFAGSAAPAVAAPSAPPAYSPPPMAATAPVAMQSGPVASAIPMPGPVAAPAPAAHVAAIAEAAVADVVTRAPAVAMENESASVVSSVRAALLGIGKA